MTWLLDGNVLLALLLDTHVHHRRAERWFAGQADAHFATCPVTEGTLIRIHMQLATDKSAAAAWDALASLHEHPRHLFWDENFSYADLSFTRITGHRQVTDSWLAELARRKQGRLATLDEGLAALWPDVATLLPVV